MFWNCFLPLVQVNRPHLIQSLPADLEAPEVPKVQREEDYIMRD